MTEIDGFFLPGIDARDISAFKHLDFEGVRVRWPQLSAAQMSDICATLRSNRQTTLAHMKVAEIVSAIDAAAASLGEDLDRVIGLISSVTAYSPATVRETLHHMLNDWRAPALEEMLRAELGNPDVLDHPVDDPHVQGKKIAAHGHPLALHIFSGNVPGVAVTSLIRSLLVKSATIGKTASGEPVLAVLFAQALQRVAPDIASCLAVTYWPSGSEQTERVVLDAADLCVVYGGQTAIQAVAKEFAPDKRLILHGPRYSFGIVNHIAQTTASSVARAVAAFDQQGCVSPHVVYVTGDAARARKFAGDVASEMKSLESTLPRGRISAEEAVAINTLRAESEFSDRDVQLFGEDNDRHCVIFEADPSFRVSCLNRVLFVKPAASAADVIAQLPRIPEVQSVAIEGFPENEKAELIRLLGQSGVSRITTFDKLPWPPMHWHHDGSSPLRELLWWLDVEA